MTMTREEREKDTMSITKNFIHALKEDTWPFLAHLDISMAQVRTLHLLAEEGPMVIGQVAQSLGIGQSTAGHLVDRLVKAGLAQRTEDSEDRRRTVAHLTEAGWELFNRFRVNSEQMAIMLKELSDDDLNALHQGLKALQQAIQKCRKQRTLTETD
jgi:DNA-binding MarR family transcriptional regulator